MTTTKAQTAANRRSFTASHRPSRVKPEKAALRPPESTGPSNDPSYGRDLLKEEQSRATTELTQAASLLQHTRAQFDRIERVFHQVAGLLADDVAHRFQHEARNPGLVLVGEGSRNQDLVALGGRYLNLAASRALEELHQRQSDRAP